jgi:hypothetical protein
MLKVVDVDVAGLEGEVRGRPVAELNDLDVQPCALASGTKASRDCA